MPVPAFNLYPPFSIVRVSHTELVVRDLAASRALYVDTLGLQVTFEDSGMICLRAMEERGHHCLILCKGDDPVSRYLAFRVFSEEDLDKAEAHFAGQGRETSWVERPFQGRTLRVLDPHGIPMEFYFEMERLATIEEQQAYDRYMTRKENQDVLVNMIKRKEKTAQEEAEQEQAERWLQEKSDEEYRRRVEVAMLQTSHSRMLDKIYNFYDYLKLTLEFCKMQLNLYL